MWANVGQRSLSTPQVQAELQSLQTVTEFLPVLTRLLVSFFQKFLTPASYWHDDLNEERYRRGSSFLAIINNENHYNSDYVKNLKSLRRLILVKFMKDVSLVPNESSWFGFASSNGTKIPMEETNTFRHNRLGLREMRDEGRLIRIASPLQHLELDKVWFRNNLIPVLKENWRFCSKIRN